MNEENFKNEEYWEETKKKVQREANISDITYNIWFKNLEFQEVTDDAFFIRTDKDDERALAYLNTKFQLYFDTVVSEELGRIVQVKFLLSNEKTPSVHIPEPKKPANDIFNPDYTFESFVIGKNNMMAHQVAVAVEDRHELQFVDQRSAALSRLQLPIRRIV